MSGGDTGVCWCASGDAKCPHNINSRINGLWNEMEAAVDEVLEQFDRRSIKKFLSKDHKPSQTEKVSKWSRRHCDKNVLTNVFISLTIPIFCIFDKCILYFVIIV